MTPDRRPEKRSERRPEKRPEQKETATLGLAARGLDRVRPEASREPRRAPRLDTPREAHRALVWHPSFGGDTFGVFAGRFARFMGTPQFLIWMTLFVVVWIAINVVGIWGMNWDPYPFILLNLFFSTQASYAAPLILLAQNRQEDRDRVVTEQDRQANTRAHADMEFLTREVASLRMALGEVATRDFLRSELRALLGELEERATAGGAEAEGADEDGTGTDNDDGRATSGSEPDETDPTPPGDRGRSGETYR